MLLVLLACQSVPRESPPIPPGPPLLAGPSEDGYDPDLAQRADDYDRVFLAISAAPFGMSLDAATRDPAPIRDWLATGSGYTQAEFEEQSGIQVYDLVQAYGEMGDLGMFGGVAAVAEARRYQVLREDPDTSHEMLEDARSALERVLRSLHTMQAITGRPGSLVRGLGKVDMPGMENVELIPLTDGSGNPLPTEKHGGVWREDASGEFPDFYWMDDTSKDQWTGYIVALGACWEAAKNDPAIDQDLVETLEADALAMGKALQEPSPVTGLDLTLIDGDGRPTTFHDLNARELEGAVSESNFNPDNAIMALAGLKVLAVVSQDPGLRDFYREVAVDRGYAELTGKIGAVTYLGYLTNYSNVNMVWTALYSLLNLEADPALRELYLAAMESAWAKDTPRAPWHFHNAWFSFTRAVHGEMAEEDLRAAIENLRGFHPAPYTNEYLENCDPEEIKTGQCLAVDGTTLIDLYGTWNGEVFVPGSARNASPVASSFLPQSIRPESDFEWRSDPYRVNGGGDGNSLDPAGDWRAAYWSGRFLRPGTLSKWSE